MASPVGCRHVIRCVAAAILVAVTHGGVASRAEDRFAYRQQMRQRQVTAIVNYTYVDEQGTRYLMSDLGRFGTNVVDTLSGVVSHAWTVANKSDGCAPLRPGVARREPWVALVRRGECNFNTKIRNAAMLSNASGVIVYNNKANEPLLMMEHQVYSVVAVFINQARGEEMATWADAGHRVEVTVSVGSTLTRLSPTINQTSVLFVSISFIVLMIISLAWLIFYYIQRFRYAHAKDRMQKRLANAARKAVTKIPTKVIKANDPEVEVSHDPCAVCIEGYTPHDVLRILPCKHQFHKTCIDPWLIEHRTCPMCKLDILKAYGLQFSERRRCATILVSTTTDPTAVADNYSQRPFVSTPDRLPNSATSPTPATGVDPDWQQQTAAGETLGAASISVTVHSGSSALLPNRKCSSNSTVSQGLGPAAGGAAEWGVLPDISVPAAAGGSVAAAGGKVRGKSPRRRQVAPSSSGSGDKSELTAAAAASPASGPDRQQQEDEGESDCEGSISHISLSDQESDGGGGCGEGGLGDGNILLTTRSPTHSPHSPARSPHSPTCSPHSPAAHPPAS